MKIYQSPILNNFSNLTHAFTTKDGGVSNSPYSSLNLAFHVEDNPSNVTKNHEKLASELNYDRRTLVHMKQIHSDLVHVVGDRDNFDNPPICDALITDKKNIPLMVMVADCSPILFYDDRKKVIAVAHAGRQGAFKNIVQNVINTFTNIYDSHTENIFVTIGANIGVCCYEVGNEIYEEAKKLNLDYAIEKRDNSFYLDVNKILITQLLTSAIKEENIEILDECTCCNSDKYFSYRADGTTGRFAGVDEMSWDDVDAKNYAWPKVDEVREYRNKVKELVDELIMTIPLTLPITDDSDMWVILMGIEHERIHIETSLVLHRQMPIEFVKETDAFNICTHSAEAPTNEMIGIKSQHIELGKDKQHHLYGWDNEYGTYEEDVEEFKTSKFLVSNGEFMEFVENGGYKTQEFWDDEGKEFLKISGALYPAFWVLEDSTYKYRTLSKIIEMPLDWPVDVNALEAEAFCRYKSQKDGVTYSLPSEAEYRAIYNQSRLQDIPNFHESRANLNFYHYASSCPVNEFSFNGIFDVVGNVWQWSRTPIRGFEGFEVHSAYDDFSVPTFDDKHALILGSSWASSGNLIMKHSRYAFRKHFPQNAGFRYVISDNSNDEEVDIYESDELVSQYCEFQYGDTHFGVENFAIECAKIASKFAIKKGKALDLGCATGRATYELAKEFGEVEGIDFSVRFVQVGAKLKDDGFVAFHSREEGELVIHKKVTIEELGYENLKEKVSFWQGDACNLKPNFNSYDLVIATNLIDRLYNPRLFLDTIDERLNDDGILILTSPYTWQESSTAKELWLGGYVDANGVEVKTIDSLETVLEDKFELLHTQDLDFVIKETARKYQHTISQVSVWKKK